MTDCYLKKVNAIVCLILFCLLTFSSGQVNAQFIEAQPDPDLPENFPEIKVSVMENLTPGNLFIGPFGAWGMYTDVDSYMTIIDNYGHSIFYKKISHSSVNDLKLQPNGQLTYADGNGPRNYVLNEKMEVVDSLKPVGYWTDLHEIIITENNHKFLLGIDTRLVDMSEIVEGGQENATVTGHAVQEWDADNNVIFEWNSWDHYSILDCEPYIDVTAQAFEYTHINTIEIDSDTSLLVLPRNMNEITKIDRRTGEIIWRLGGVNNEFTFINDTLQWAWPHDIRNIGDGLFSLFDNGRFNTPAPHFSSGVIYEIDEHAKTITQIKRFRSEPEVYGDIMGNFQHLDNGHFITGWGSGSHPDSIGITEFTADGDIVHVVKMGAINYRAWKFNWQPKLFSADQDTIDMGELVHETWLAKNITIYNYADYEVPLTGYHLRFGHFEMETEFPVTIPANGSTDIIIKFQPDEAGEFEDALTIHSTNEKNTQRIGRQIYLKASAQQGFGINENSTVIRKIKPNPTTDFITITFNKSISGEYRIANLTGNIVRISQIENSRFVNADVSDLSQGLYFIYVNTNENQKITSKFIKH